MSDRKENQFIQYVRYDLYQGFVLKWKRYIFFLIFVISLGVGFMMKHRNVMIFSGLEQSLSAGDFILYILKGMRFYQPSSMDIYIPNFVWIFIFMYIDFSVAYYPLKDLYGYGQQLLLQSKQRRYWWFSKCIWTIWSVVVFYFIIIMSAFICGMITGNVSILPQTGIQAYYHQIDVRFINSFHFVFSAIICPIFVTAAMSLFQMMWSTLVHPLIGLIITASIYIMSIYFSWPWMLGNYLMLMRNHMVNETSQILTEKGLLYSLIIILCSGFIGYIGFRKKDILAGHSE